MGLFSGKKVEKEASVSTNVTMSKPKKEFSKAKFYYLLWNIVYMSFTFCYAFYLIITVAEQNFLADVIKFLLYFYGAVLVLVILFSIGSKKKLKRRLTTYKSALNFLKYLIQLISFSLAIVNAISSFFITGKFDSNALSSAFASLILTVIMAVIEIVKIMIRKNVPIVKQNLLKIKEREEIERQERIQRKLQLLEDKKNFKDMKRQKNFSSVKTQKPSSVGSVKYTPQTAQYVNKNTGRDELDYHRVQSNQTNQVNQQYQANNGSQFKQEESEYKMKSGLFGGLLKHASNNKADNLKDSYTSYDDGYSKKQDIDYPILSKSQRYDEDAGVVIDYDDDEDDYYSDEVLRDNKINKNGKFSKFFGKFGKK